MPVANSKAICNKGFSCDSNILPRSNFCAVEQESSPQSLTAYSRKTLYTRLTDHYNNFDIIDINSKFLTFK
jgi:hypothetical protein